MRQSINGILLLDKPEGISSNDALQKVKRFFNAEKAGHSGTLDPIATGLLPIYFGEATKFIRFQLEADKRYRVKAKLGVRTDSADKSGKIIAERCLSSVAVTQDQIEHCILHFTGDQTQIPPMFSALKHQGEPLYKLARQGIEVAREPRAIRVYEVDLISVDNDHFILELSVSKGTYIRTLIDDMGEYLGCGAHVVELRRLKVGDFEERDSVKFEMLQTANTANTADTANYNSRFSCSIVSSSSSSSSSSGYDLCSQSNLPFLLPVDHGLTSLPAIHLSDPQLLSLKQGQAIHIPSHSTPGWVRLIEAKTGTFIGVGEALEDGKIVPRRLLSLS